VTIIGVIFTAITLMGYVEEIDAVNSLNQILGLGISTGTLIFAIILIVLSLVANVIFVVFLVKRNPNCVLIFHISIITYIIGLAIVLGFYGSLIESLGSTLVSASESAELYSTQIIEIVRMIGFMILWTIYFRKSVRMRTYMGSDEYLRKSPLTKGTVSPIPADGSFNTPPPM